MPNPSLLLAHVTTCSSLQEAEALLTGGVFEIKGTSEILERQPELIKEALTQRWMGHLTEMLLEVATRPISEIVSKFVEALVEQPAEVSDVAERLSRATDAIQFDMDKLRHDFDDGEHIAALIKSIVSVIGFTYISWSGLSEGQLRLNLEED